MGLFKNSGCGCDMGYGCKSVRAKPGATERSKLSKEVRLPNPDPKNFELKSSFQVGKYSVVKIHYPDCTNYEGMKILVYHAPLKEIVGADFLGSHFYDNKENLTPIARFKPDDEGLKMALSFVNILNTTKI